MYCKRCGKKIDDDSTFCMYCGQEITIPSDESMQSPVTDAECSDMSVTTSSAHTKETCDSAPKKRRSRTLPLLLILFSPIIFLVIMVAIIIAKDSKPTVASGSVYKTDNKLRTCDYSYSESQDLTSYTIFITPNRDIKNCSIELTLYNENGAKIYANTITKTNLVDGSTYAYTFEYGVTNALSGSKVYYTITGERE